MVSINTNLSSLIAQTSFNKSTNILNQAVERMSTGYKINHASDNAANYSISTNMSTQISSYDVAEDNVAMGLDLLSTAQDTLNVMADNASRLHSLCTQARNGTYGAQSLAAINQEAASIVANIKQVYNSAQYNGISLFDRSWYELSDSLESDECGFIKFGDPYEPEAAGLTSDLTPTHNGFIAEVDEVTPYVTVKDKTQLLSAITAAQSATNPAQKIVGIEDDVVLAELAKIVNGTDGYSGNNCEGVTICLTDDIDLRAYCAEHTDSEGNGGWTPIGNDSNKFNGTFNGNGHEINNLYIKRTSTDYQGLFGYLDSRSEIKNTGLNNINIEGRSVTGGLVGFGIGGITNSYSTGSVKGENNIGGLIGHSYLSTAIITNSYSTCLIEGYGYTGGLVGKADTNTIISNSYATGSVTGTICVGGLVGYANLNTNISNSYASGSVTGASNIGGLVGYAWAIITNSCATGSVAGTNTIGGLVGGTHTSTDITNSYASGSVTGASNIGGLVGNSSYAVTNCYATGDVTGTGDYIGGLIGCGNSTNSSVSNSYALGDVTKTGTSGTQQYIGGLIGYTKASISDSYAKGNVTGDIYNGGLVGGTSSAITNSYASGSVDGKNNTGGLVGYATGELKNSYATGDVSGNVNIGGVAGNLDNGAIQKCYSTGAVTGHGNVGGLAGYATNNAEISGSYAKGDVSGEAIVGGLVGCSDNGHIDMCYSGNKVSGNMYVGGLAGIVSSSDGSISNTNSYAKVSGNEGVGSFIGAMLGPVEVENCQSGIQGMDMISGAYNQTGWDDENDLPIFEIVDDVDLTEYTDNIAGYTFLETGIGIQVGIYSDENSNRVAFDSNFELDLDSILNNIESDETYTTIQSFLNVLNEKATELGAAQNRLESALEEITVKRDNLVSSRSTLKDADIAKVSATYIQQQILQQAAATLLATANQNPAIALQLI